MADCVEHLYLKNLRDTVNEAILREDLKHKFPEYFKVPDEQGTLKIKVYKRKKIRGGKETGGIEVVATVSGARVDLIDLKNKARNQRLHGFRYAFFSDLGDERDENGYFVKKMKTEEKMRIRDIMCESLRKCTLYIQPEIAEQLNGCFDGSKKASVKNVRLSIQQLEAEYVSNEKDTQTVFYHSSLDCLQKICLLNKTATYDSQNHQVKQITFMNKKTGASCSFFGIGGLGVCGKVIDVEEIQNKFGYVPFDMLNDKIINVSLMKSLSSKCLVCDRPFELLGVDKDLGFIAARCNSKKTCSYETLDVSRRMYTWPKEDFTRLIEVRQNAVHQPKLDILFRPMKKNYQDGQEFKEIVAPLVMWEWYTEYHEFQSHEVETRVNKSVKDESLKIDRKMTISFDINESAMWCPKSIISIGELNLKMRIQNNKKWQFVTRKASKFWIDENEEESGKVKIYAKIQLFEDEKPLNKGAKIDVCPVPDSMERRAIISFLDRWSTGEAKTVWLQHALNLGSAVPVFLPVQGEIEGAYLNQGYSVMRQLCNQNQLEAIDNALKYSTSIIIGPPGTGKTRTCAMIMIALKLTKPESKLIALAPTNYACDVLCETLSKIIDQHWLVKPPFKILRIYSKTKEELYNMEDKKIELGNHVEILHEVIHQKFVNSGEESIQSAYDVATSKDKMEITEGDLESYQDLYRTFEGEVIRNSSYRIIVMTSGTFHDKRFRTRQNKPRFQADTIVLDEAGYMTHTESLAVLDYGQERVIYAGDDRQLRKMIVCPGVGMTGYANSTIEWARLSNCKLPWVTLQTQYRMNPEISNFVSELTYPDVPITTHESVKNEIPAAVMKALQPKRPIYVVYHNGQEKTVGSSFTNPTEVDVITKICKRLRAENVPTRDIGVISLYAAQRNLLKESLLEMEIESKTVDSVQGREYNIVIVSCVRSGDDGVGFAKEPNRCNVMLSRAKEFMVLVINKKTFSSCKYQNIKKMMSLLEKYGDSVDASVFAND